jgi:hypothetical protein
MSAYHEIYVLIYGYAERIDAGDFEGLADLLAHAELTFEGYDAVRRGRDDILDLYQRSTRRYPDDGTPKSKHLVTNVVVDLDETSDPATAVARSYYTVLQAVPGALALQPIVSGRYRDRFAHLNGAWRFTGRHIYVDLVGELGHHMLFDL